MDNLSSWSLWKIKEIFGWLDLITFLFLQLAREHPNPSRWVVPISVYPRRLSSYVRSGACTAGNSDSNPFERHTDKGGPMDRRQFGEFGPAESPTFAGFFPLQSLTLVVGEHRTVLIQRNRRSSVEWTAHRFGPLGCEL